MNKNSKWRAFHNVVERHLWGIESDDPDLVANGDEVIVSFLTQKQAEEIADAHNAAIAKAGEV